MSETTTSPAPPRTTSDQSQAPQAVTAFIGAPGFADSVVYVNRGGGLNDILEPSVKRIVGSRFGDTFNVGAGKGEWAIDAGPGADTLVAVFTGFHDAAVTGTPGSPIGLTMSLGPLEPIPVPTTGGGTVPVNPGALSVPVYRGFLAFEGTVLKLANLERAEFVDGALSFDLSGAPAQVHRLYRAALGREPDPTGLHDWVDRLEHGGSPKALAQGFLGSEEFAARFSAAAGPDNGAFVEQLYQNVRHRPSDPTGKANWLEALAAGARDRADVLTEFAQGRENTDNTREEVWGGIWLLDERAAEVARLYDTVLGRLPDERGLLAWKNALSPGHGREELVAVAGSFLASEEFQSKYGALDDAAFVAALYRDALDREPDAERLGVWIKALSGGMTRDEAAVGFSESAEHVALTAPHIGNGVWFA